MLKAHLLIDLDSIGSAFTFDFRSSSRVKRPFQMNLPKSSRSAETLEYNGNKAMELQLRLQSQQEELSRMQEEQNHLQEELSSQKVQEGDNRMGKGGDLKTTDCRVM